MTAPQRVLLAGASGLVGDHVLARLLAAQMRVLAPVRRPLARQSGQLQVVVDPLLPAGDDGALLSSLESAMPTVDAFVCCLGTTIKKAGSREAFLAVDRDLVLRLAVAARAMGARQAILASSVGASAQSGNFYLRVKGESERALAELGFDRLDLLRPGLLLGKRDESRPGESLARVVAPIINPLLAGPWRRYRAIAADDVAAAAVALLAQAEPGRHVHEHAGLLALAADGAQA